MSEKRGFNSVEEHDEFIVTNWNSIVNTKDVVWILGDITMENSRYEILSRLKGIKRVVLGNHDRGVHVPELLKYVKDVCAMKTVRGFLLTHCPIHPSELYRYRGNIHGHLHEKSLLTEGYFNMSCENINYIPMEIPEKE